VLDKKLRLTYSIEIVSSNIIVTPSGKNMSRFSLRLFALALISILTNHLVAATLADAQQAYASGSYAKAFDMYMPLARKGEQQAQLSVGVMYYIGQSVTQDRKEAAKWFSYAGKQGNALAQNIMGEMHDQGLGVPQNYKTAAKWYRLSAKQGNAQGQYNLGIMYERELGVPQDYVLAYMWLLLAKAPTESLKPVANQMTNEQISRAKQLAKKCTANKFKRC